MSLEKINHYKKTVKLRFCDEKTEQDFQKFQLKRGRSTANYSLTALAVINLAFAFLEHWILGINSVIPLFSYIFIAALCLVAVLFSVVSTSTAALKLRILVPGVLTIIVLIWALYLQNYRLYHAVEITLLVVWMGSLNVLGFRLSSILSLSAALIFTVVVILLGATTIKIFALIALMIAAYSLALYLSYMMERFRRMMYLTNESLNDVYTRQENWAYTLIDLDMSLSGIVDFKKVIGRLMEHIKTVIDYESYVVTSLDGKGVKPKADEIDGTLFEQDDETLWTDDLLSKLTQTRQASVSAQFDIAKGFFGKEKKNFQHYRLDIPIFNNSTLVGVVSLRRESPAFDDLDMTASVSIATQAMMIFNRTAKAASMARSSLMSAGLKQGATTKAVTPESKPPVQQSKTVIQESKPPVQQSKTVIQESKSPVQQSKPVIQEAKLPVQKPEPVIAESKPAGVGKESSSPSSDMDLTADLTNLNPPPSPVKKSAGRDVTVVPTAVLKKIQQETESARKTITLLSRENAEHISMDRYRTAAVEGEPLSLLLVEVDGLSSIREKEGDQTAYKIFSGIVKYIFSKTDKDTDVLGRYGQNGFSILLPRVDMNAAEKFAEKLREYTEKMSFQTANGERKATLSIGIAAITEETGNHDSMVRRADMALFVAKKNGRNCVKVRL